MEPQDRHLILGGKAYLFKRDRSPFWQARTYLNETHHHISTKADYLPLAIQFAEEWYIHLRAKAAAGALGLPDRTPTTPDPAPPSPNPVPTPQEPTFREVADQFLKEYEVITEGQRSKRWVQGHAIRLRVHLLPFFG